MKPQMNADEHGSPFRRRGAAMSEMVLALPLLFVILGLLLYFGRGMVRVQHAQVMDRYEAWRQAGDGQGPWADPPSGNVMLNETFFADNAESITYTGSDYFPDDAPLALIAAAAAINPDAGELAVQMFQGDDRLPQGRAVQLSTEYTTNVPLFRALDGPITHEHVRLDNDWRFVNGWRDIEGHRWRENGGPWLSWPPDVDWQTWQTHGTWRYEGLTASHLPAVNDSLFTLLDSEMLRLENQGNNLARAIRDTYLRSPSYFGPTVDFE